MTHANAPLTPEGRRRLAHLVVEEGWPMRQVGQHHASDVGAGDHQQGDGIVDCDLCRRCHGQAAHPGEQARPSTVCTCRAHKLRTSCQLERETGRGQEGERAGQSRGRLTDRARAYKHREPSPA